MALFTPSASPAITVKEIDLTGVVPNVTTSTGAFVGEFKWGPINSPILVSNEAGLVEAFGTPDSDNTVEWHSAAYFLRYGDALYIVRGENNTGDLPVNAYDASAAVGIQDSADYAIPSASRPLVKTEDDWDNQKTNLASTSFTSDLDSSTVSLNHTFLAKWPGEIGSSLSVHFLGADSASDTTAFDAWTYRTSFDAAPKTSSYASDRGASNDEMHVAVVDEDGLFSGTRGTILETFPYLSIAKNATNADGSTNYMPDVINNASKYIWMAGFGPALTSNGRNFSYLAGTNADSADDFTFPGGPVAQSVSLINGRDTTALDAGDYATGFDQFEDTETITVDMLIAPGMNARADQTTVVNDLISIAGTTRKDCVVVASPARSDIINNATPVAESITTADTFTNSSYLIVDNNYLKVYDKYNDQYIKIPASSSTAGLLANTDFVAAPWFSPAGSRRGQYLGITALAYSPNKSERDQLYRAGINPIANIPGQGVLLFGDKTKLARPSAFDRINVRRLFLGIERAIAIAARNVMFEFNDEFTRAEFKNVIEPFLREIQGRRGITDFRVVCDETNNTAAVVDRNEFIANIFIKPARSINYVTLNFVAVRTGVDFEEVVGTV